VWLCVPVCAAAGAADGSGLELAHAALAECAGELLSAAAGVSLQRPNFLGRVSPGLGPGSAGSTSMRAGTESPQARIDPGGRFILLTLPPGVSLPLEPLAAIAGQPLTPTAPSSSGGGVGSAPRSRVLGVQARVGAGRDWQTRPVALAVHLGDLEEQGYAAAAAGAVRLEANGGQARLVRELCRAVGATAPGSRRGDGDKVRTIAFVEGAAGSGRSAILANLARSLAGDGKVSALVWATQHPGLRASEAIRFAARDLGIQLVGPSYVPPEEMPYSSPGNSFLRESHGARRS
jgi:hypothetical protein